MLSQLSLKFWKDLRALAKLPVFKAGGTSRRVCATMQSRVTSSWRTN